MQTLMNDQLQPACSRPENNSGECGDRDYNGGPTQALLEPPNGTSTNKDNANEKIRASATATE